ncbi:hypothetical protein Slin15195_G081000 [Septoria linicola]|uniref:Uncharacterized protein n=1 Tax=Septoria linicola TaxID=215465 RepID=A0A9Q9EKG5_9PEZI|nr:hypothetical protein Slin14017_G042210 [Septoria linicola]USW54781.1 hypothetical protein Slin15195_G081000 [Septoria linicola]
MPFDINDLTFRRIANKHDRRNGANYHDTLVMSRTLAGYTKVLSCGHGDVANLLRTSTTMNELLSATTNRIAPMHVKLGMVLNKATDSSEEHQLLCQHMANILPTSEVQAHGNRGTVGKVQSRGLFIKIDCDATSWCVNDATDAVPEDIPDDFGMSNLECGDVATPWDINSTFPDQDDGHFTDAWTVEEITESQFETQVSEHTSATASAIDYEDKDVEDSATNGTDEEDVTFAPSTETKINDILVASPEFQDFQKRLQLCDSTEDLIILWSTKLDEYGDEEQTQDIESVNILRDALVEAAEKMPHLTRYVICVNRFCTFAQRKRGQAWSDERVHRVAYQANYTLEHAQLLDDLHVKFAPSKGTGMCTCGCMGLQDDGDDNTQVSSPVSFEMW